MERVAKSAIPICAKTLINNLFIVFRGAFEPTLIIETSHHHHITDRDRKSPVHIFALRHIRHTILVIAKRETMNENVAVLQRQQSDHGFEQRGLARAIRSDNGHAGAMRHAERQIVQNGFVTVANINGFDFQTMGSVSHLICDFELMICIISTLQRFA